MSFRLVPKLVTLKNDIERRTHGHYFELFHRIR